MVLPNVVFKLDHRDRLLFFQPVYEFVRLQLLECLGREAALSEACIFRLLAFLTAPLATIR